MSETKSALIIANYRYEHPDLRQLVAPAQDAESLARVLQDPTICGFQVQTLINESSHNLNLEIETFFDNRKRDDLLLLYFSGHGIKDADGKLYFATVDTQLVQRNVRRATAVSAQFVNEVMSRSRSRRQILLLDCCYSGAFKEGMLAKGDKRLGAGEQLEGQGRVVLTASDALQYSFEGGQVQGEGVRSVFTRTLIHGLESGEADLDRDGLFSLDEVYDYVYGRVADELPEQKPTKMGYAEGKIFLGNNPRPLAGELPPELRESIEDRRPWVRLSAVQELEKLLRSNNKGLVLAAENALLALAKGDDSLQVITAATKSLTDHADLLNLKGEQAAPEVTADRTENTVEEKKPAEDSLQIVAEASVPETAESRAAETLALATPEDTASKVSGDIVVGRSPATKLVKRSLMALAAIAAFVVLLFSLLPRKNPQTAGQRRNDASTTNGETGESYYNAGQYEKALPLLRKEADAGNAQSMTYLGLMYKSGKGGLPKDDAQSLSWYRRAADVGETAAMYNLGTMYEDGEGGLQKNDAQAVAWYRKAADAGDSWAMNKMGFMYQDGRGGLPKDDAQAVAWYRKSAGAGYSKGMGNLGFMYENGRGGLPKDDAQAVAWYRKAADAGDRWAMNKMGIMYEDGRGALPKDDVQAVAWYRKAADAGSADGMNNLGVGYVNGQGGLPKDGAQAVVWYRKAADAGSAAGMRNLGLRYQNGEGGVPKDDAQAVSWYRKAADAGSEDAMNDLGLMYENGGGGLPKNDVLAASWYRKAANAGNAKGMENLGFMYEKGRGGLPEDPAQAVTWYRKAAKLGDQYAKDQLTRLGHK